MWIFRRAIAYWCERPDLLAEIAEGKNEEDRMLRVLKWFIVRVQLVIFIDAVSNFPSWTSIELDRNMVVHVEEPIHNT